MKFWQVWPVACGVWLVLVGVSLTPSGRILLPVNVVTGVTLLAFFGIWRSRRDMKRSKWRIKEELNNAIE